MQGRTRRDDASVGLSHQLVSSQPAKGALEILWIAKMWRGRARPAEQLLGSEMLGVQLEDQGQEAGLDLPVRPP